MRLVMMAQKQNPAGWDLWLCLCLDDLLAHTEMESYMSKTQIDEHMN